MKWEVTAFWGKWKRVAVVKWKRAGLLEWRCHFEREKGGHSWSGKGRHLVKWKRAAFSEVEKSGTLD